MQTGDGLLGSPLLQNALSTQSSNMAVMVDASQLEDEIAAFKMTHKETKVAC